MNTQRQKIEQANSAPRLWERALALPQLGIAAARETFACLFDRSEVALNHEYRKQHELGHALLLFLTRDLHSQDTQTIHVNRLQGQTCAAIQQVVGESVNLLGKRLDFSAGEATIGEEAEQAFIESHPKEASLFLLAGIAATIHNTKYHKYFMGLLKKCFANPQQATWTDFTKPYQFLKTRFIELAGRSPTDQELETVFMNAITALSQAFQEKDSLQALECIDTQLDSDARGQISNDALSNSLQQRNIPEFELRQRILGLDFDSIIRGVA